MQAQLRNTRGKTRPPRLLVILVVLLSVVNPIQAEERALFSEALLTDSLRAVVAAGMEETKKDQGTKRIRLVNMDVQALKEMKSGRVVLNMFPDKAFRVELKPQSNRSNRHVTHSLWKGSVVGIPDSEVRVSIWDENIFTSVRIGTITFTSEPIDKSRAIIRELDVTAFRPMEENDVMDLESTEHKE